MFTLLTMAEKLAQQQAQAASSLHQTPAALSGMKPLYLKPAASARR